MMRSVVLLFLPWGPLETSFIAIRLFAASAQLFYICRVSSKAGRWYTSHVSVHLLETAKEEGTTRAPVPAWMFCNKAVYVNLV